MGGVGPEQQQMMIEGVKQMIDDLGLLENDRGRRNRGEESHDTSTTGTIYKTYLTLLKWNYT